MTRLRHTKRKKEKTKKPATEERVQQTDYGPVVVVHDCKYKGRVAVTPLALEKWKRENPELAKQCGVP